MIKTAWSGSAWTWSLMTYASFEELERLKARCKHWATCLHDKDVDEETGELITPHIHMLCTFDNQIALSTIIEIIGSNQNTLGECRRKNGDKWVNLNIPQLYDYLIHKGYDDKYQYEETEREIDSWDYWKRYDRDAKPSNDDFLKDLCGVYLNEREFLIEMGAKYGRDFIKNHSYYCKFRYKLGYGYTESRERITDYEDLCYQKMEREEE